MCKPSDSDGGRDGLSDLGPVGTTERGEQRVYGHCRRSGLSESVRTAGARRGCRPCTHVREEESGRETGGTKGRGEKKGTQSPE